MPEIKYDFGGVMVTFAGVVPDSSDNEEKMSVEMSVKTPEMIIRKLGENPEMTLAEVALAINKSLRAVERASKKLVSDGRLQHLGPKKGGHWEVGMQ